MVQELHVLRCCFCETFQTQIVKKSNKWECKLCGTKQSVKKVYGRGSGKDCRLHTQKLNALRGEKEEDGFVSKMFKETNRTTPERVQENIECSQTNTEVKIDPPKASKWAAYVDEVKIEVSKATCSTEGKTINKLVTDVQENDCYGPKTKRNYDVCSNEFEDNFDSFEENDNCSFRYRNSKKNSKRGKYVKYYNNKFNEHHSDSIDQDFKLFASEKCESSNVKIKKKPHQNVKADVSLKWAKYLNLEGINEKEPTYSQNVSESQKHKIDYINGERTGNILDSLENRESVIDYEQAENFPENSDNSDHSYNFNLNGGEKKKNSQTPLKILDQKSVVDSCIKSTMDPEEIQQNKRKSNLDSARTFSLPVFEQSSNLNDTDFELDF